MKFINLWTARLETARARGTPVDSPAVAVAATGGSSKVEKRCWLTARTAKTSLM
jgi:hypothetical protein